MRRALVAISIFLASAACALADPIAGDATVDAATPGPSKPAPTEPASSAPAAVSTDTAASDDTKAREPMKTADATPRATTAAEVPRVELRKPANETVCRRERPTGSQISVQRCYTRSTAGHGEDDQLLRSDLDRIREQENDRQARDAAAAMRGRTLGP
jgi:hypothetical protein